MMRAKKPKSLVKRWSEEKNPVKIVVKNPKKTKKSKNA